MKEIKLTEQQKKAAHTLLEGDVIFAYLDGTAIRMETDLGQDPYVWHNDKWVPMRNM